MQYKQHIVLVIGLAALVGIVLFPPYRVSTVVDPNNILAGAGDNGASVLQYGFLLAPPPYAEIAWSHVVYALGLVVVMTTAGLLLLKGTQD